MPLHFCFSGENVKARLLEEKRGLYLNRLFPEGMERKEGGHRPYDESGKAQTAIKVISPLIQASAEQITSLTGEGPVIRGSVIMTAEGPK